MELPDKNKDVYILIANNIKKYREKNNLTQLQLSKLSGYSYAYIRRIEAPGCIKNFSIQTISVIAKSLNIDIKNLFENDNI